jgi:RHH-type transcriptional regulator, rel operon repressor / antitoxin RelB
MLAIRLPADIESRLTALAEKTGRSKSFYAREAIIKHIESLEELYLAEERLEEIKAGRAKAVPLDDVITRATGA